MYREQLIALATEAARDPSRAARIAGLIADTLSEALSEGEGGAPPGYLYATAMQWIIQVSDLVPEPVPPSANGVPITTSANDFVPLRVPFDALIVGSAGWAEISPGGNGVDLATWASLLRLPSAIDGRDLFSVLIGIDGQAQFGSDGRTPLMLPASTVVGSRLQPRPMAWTVRRNSNIQAKFRNLTNVVLNMTPDIIPVTNLKKAAIAFYALNLEMP